MDNSKNSSMMYEHLEGYVNECVKHLAIGSIAPQDNTDAEFFDEHDRIRNEDNTLTPAIDYYTLAGVEGGGMNHDRVYVCVGRMFLFFIVQVPSALSLTPPPAPSLTKLSLTTSPLTHSLSHSHSLPTAPPPAF